MLLFDIKAVFDDKSVDRLSSEELCEALANMEGRPWAEFSKSRKPVSKNQLARLLGDFRRQAGHRPDRLQDRKGVLPTSVC